METYDIIGVGFGPANIALAVALEEEGLRARTLFLERNSQPVWQPEMLLSGSDIQNHPLRDLITPVNPRSKYSFTNYLHCHGRLFEYLNLGTIFPLRREYAEYVRWVARHFDGSAVYGAPVGSIELVAGECPLYVVNARDQTFLSRVVVLAPGRSPHIPEPFTAVLGPRVFHLSAYESSIKALAGELRVGGCIAVVGASQSAVEIVLDISNRFPEARVQMLARSFGPRLKDTSPFSEEVYFPQFVDYFFGCDTHAKRRLEHELRPTNYSSVDQDVLHALYGRIYEQRLSGLERITIRRNVEILECEPFGEKLEMMLRERNYGQETSVRVDAVVLATGFNDLGVGHMRESAHPLMARIVENLAVNDQPGARVNRDYSVALRGSDSSGFYLNGLCESTHGFGDAGSFSVLSIRAREIVKSISRHLYGRASEPTRMHDAGRTGVAMVGLK